MEEDRSPREALLVAVSWVICRQRVMWLLIRPARVRKGNMLHSGGDDLGLGF